MSVLVLSVPAAREREVVAPRVEGGALQACGGRSRPRVAHAQQVHAPVARRPRRKACLRVRLQRTNSVRVQLEVTATLPKQPKSLCATPAASFERTAAASSSASFSSRVSAARAALQLLLASSTPAIKARRSIVAARDGSGILVSWRLSACVVRLCVCAIVPLAPALNALLLVSRKSVHTPCPEREGWPDKRSCVADRAPHTRSA